MHSPQISSSPFWVGVMLPGCREVVKFVVLFVLVLSRALAFEYARKSTAKSDEVNPAVHVWEVPVVGEST